MITDSDYLEACLPVLNFSQLKVIKSHIHFIINEIDILTSHVIPHVLNSEVAKLCSLTAPLTIEDIEEFWYNQSILNQKVTMMVIIPIPV